MYKYLISINASEDRTKRYADQWIKYEKMTNMKLNEEYNTKANKRWKDNLRCNPKRLWEMIDWKDSKVEAIVPQIDSNIVKKYFTNIFQNSKIINNPVVDNIMVTINSYHCYVPLLDDRFSINEFNNAISEIGKGIGLMVFIEIG